MERDSENSKGLEWENLAIYGGKAIEIPNQIGFPMSTLRKPSYINNPTSSSTSNKPNSFSQHFSNTDANVTNTCTYDNITKKQNVTGSSLLPGISACSSEPTIGLRLGEGRENRESFSTASMATRTPRTSMQNPCCQVEGCHIDLTSAKDYHRRHRICENHSKSPMVIVAGMERRFCQQCSRFHDLAEFDDKKRSCRRRLSVHNARRRRMQPESIHLNSGLSSTLYDRRPPNTDRRPPNLPLNGLPISVSRSTWENGGSSIFRQARDTLNRPTNFAGQGRTAMQHYSNNGILNPIFSIQSSSPQVLDQCSNVPTNILPNAPDLQSAPSLLSTTTSWMHEAESRSMESLLVHGNYSPVARERFQLDNFQAQPEHSLHMQNAAGPSQMQEFELFKMHQLHEQILASKPHSSKIDQSQWELQLRHSAVQNLYYRLVNKLGRPKTILPP